MMMRLYNATEGFLSLRSNHLKSGSNRGKCNLSYEKAINRQGQTLACPRSWDFLKTGLAVFE